MKLTQHNAYFAVMVLVVLALSLAACAGAATPPPTPTAVVKKTLTVSGSGGATSVVKYLAKAYNQQHQDLAFSFLSGAGTSGAVTGALEGQLDLGTMSRAPKDSELAAGLGFVALGNERIAFVTSPDLSIPNLTSAQANDIYRGKIKNWSAVGGPDAPVNVLGRDEEETLTSILREGIFGKDPFPAEVVILTSATDMQNALAKTTNAIGYISYCTIETEGLSVHAVKIDGHNPADVQDNYPYVRTLGVGYLPANAAKVQSFLDYLSSSEARALLTKLAITPVQ